ncbi:hypothetical protein Pan153_19510 [Gimesia panareensis]|uniref:HEAT repeat domain-containing protein n=1 Tax=Gimesia panareensis TaxID=2527978 RepID=A0A518FLR8_9PLAN|nr:hypothetical protein [Gimesia panareensis]QDV17316.1 hypothetical protein Pan153_19510 [Gimesia panareensis]
MNDWDQLVSEFESGMQDAAARAGYRKLQNASEADWHWVVAALEDETQKWFVSAVFRVGPVPQRLFETMLQAAIQEVDPDSNRQFVLPCVKTFGYRKVNAFLLDVVEGDDDSEIAGAVAALYWAKMVLEFAGNDPECTLEDATLEFQKAFLELNDVWERKRNTFLSVFVNNNNVSVRQQIISVLNLDESAYPAELRPLVPRAIEIARTHADEYIRHRVEVQLGNERLLRPLPNREPSQE